MLHTAVLFWGEEEGVVWVGGEMGGWGGRGDGGGKNAEENVRKERK